MTAYVYICQGCSAQLSGHAETLQNYVPCPACTRPMVLLRGGGEGTVGHNGFTIHTPDENDVLIHLAGAYEALRRLPPTHPLDMTEFCESIHRCQSIIALRAVRRASPGEYPIHFPPLDGADPGEVAEHPAPAPLKFRRADDDEH